MLISDLFKNWRNFSGRASRLEFFVISIIGFIALILTFFLAVKVFEVFFGDYQKAFHQQVSSAEYANVVFQSALNEWLNTGNVNQTSNTITSHYQDYKSNTLQHIFFSSLSFIFFLPFIITWIAGAIRRLHDIGTFGWWVFIVLIPIYLFLDNWLIIAPLLFLFFKEGQPFYNKYGPDPKNPTAPIPLEIPKRPKRLEKFEAETLKIVEKVKTILQPYFQQITNKFKK
ncbi:DUF805 domain-containing protein [Aggregatibacter aphrophilus]|uniref:DUF805 domain-containing protein n=1 Tax=Aggregatibacter aphrophilus TaxID=732 RepID=UPI000DA2EC4C|nr:DUF805 domain-containing protein [Aggregatibacter aphrophilus]SQI93048.1 Predicted membrane protein [Aggregatibacter aphrophilus]